MAGRLKVGDLVAVKRLAGDCFFEYQLVEGGSWMQLAANLGLPAYRICEGGAFGAYEMGELLPQQPSEREWHLLMAGETVNFTG